MRFVRVSGVGGKEGAGLQLIYKVNKKIKLKIIVNRPNRQKVLLLLLLLLLFCFLTKNWRCCFLLPVIQEAARKS